MKTFEEIIRKDVDDVVDWACRVEPVNVPKVAQFAIETAADKRREVSVRDNALSILQCFLPGSGELRWGGPEVDKIISSLRQIANDADEPVALRAQARTLVLCYTPRMDGRLK